MLRLAARTVPRCISNHVVTVSRGVAHAEVEAFQSASRRTRQHVSVVAACLPVAGGRPLPLQCTLADGGPSPWKRVDVQWVTRSARCAVTSGNETLRPLIRVACARSSESSESMPVGVAARSSPAAVDGERPSRSSWCEFSSTAMTAAGPSDEWCSQSEQREQLPAKAAEAHHVHAGTGRWAHAEGGGLHAVGATSDRRSHGKVWCTKKATPPARPLRAWWESLQPTGLVARALSCLHSC
ncbi:hypothetical protein MOQ_003957 [Trypanosoma cruzi marinkellei]|uniref:Uncharacterized protein n=1 Tax=Trypanosoma cruzi marinkellei TaxID=85056 RepID=K2NBF2_TRYCR|nr:hypothetical protein MOQ_003957 [Trypanosoma cruzi marinkellei]